MKYYILFLFMSISLFSHAQHEELGKVNWLRDYDQALQTATRENKPVLLLFQEVPGCATCRNYGHNVMSHPLIVEAIETLFVPLAIFNNKGGKDADVLKKYNEPSWNNPVVRIVDHEGENLVPRVAGNYEKLAVTQAMIYALQRESIAVPGYLSLLEAELKSRDKGLETTTLSMYCFWSGEKNLGAIDGVVETQAGFMNGAEVVSVSYDPEKVSMEEILQEAQQAKCVYKVFSDNPEQIEAAITVLGSNSSSGKGNFKQDKEPKYYLTQTYYRFVPMTQLQAARVNSSLAKGENPDQYLSKGQLAILKKATQQKGQGWKNVINQDIQQAWPN
ncbi:MAG: thioredoxin family protein [Saprospiraceae bacterium]|nr:thioredoxin family protein [Saprospiraceae bacterium]